MTQISNNIYCDSFIIGLKLENKITVNPYKDYPYLIIKDFLVPEISEMVVAHVQKSSDAQVAAIKKTKKRSVVVPEVDNSIRKTLVYTLPELEQSLYDKAFLRHQQSIEDFFCLALTTSTKVQLLQYQKDFFYIKHADDSSEIVNAEKQTIGFKVVAPNRKLSTVLFATSATKEKTDEKHFSGGGLRFNYLFNEKAEPVILYPKAGDLIIFPSNPIYSHEVLPVTSGNRITLVQWHNAILT